MDDVEQDIARLRALDRLALLERWRSLFGRDAPAHLSRPLMEKAIAYEIQNKAFGGLSKRTIRALRAATSARSAAGVSHLLAPGTRLAREWNGTTHQVDVIDDGYLWQGERYRSLSAVALAITGTKWSGPRFFSLKGE